MNRKQLIDQRAQIMGHILSMCQAAQKHKVTHSNKEGIKIKDLVFQCYFMNESYVELVVTKNNEEILRASKFTKPKCYEVLTAAVMADNGIE